jgi:methionyl-tRNA formyltransferase
MSIRMNSKKVVVLSPSNFSLYTLAIIVSLQRSGVEVVGVGVRRLLNPHRLLFEMHRNAPRVIKKIWSKLVLRKQIFHTSQKETISHYLKENDIDLISVSQLCNKEKIPLNNCYEFNEPGFVNWIKGLSVNAVIFTGGGLIRKSLLNITPKGVLNCHMGILPMYRGMDLPEWAILNGELDQIGCSVHIMESGIDTGPILSTHAFPIQPGDTIRSLRDRIEYHMTSVFVKAIVGYLDDKIIPQVQSPEEGKQFFTMTSTLLAVTEQRLAKTVSKMKNIK